MRGSAASTPKPKPSLAENTPSASRTNMMVRDSARPASTLSEASASTGVPAGSRWAARAGRPARCRAWPAARRPRVRAPPRWRAAPRSRAAPCRWPRRGPARGRYAPIRRARSRAWRRSAGPAPARRVSRWPALRPGVVITAATSVEQSLTARSHWMLSALVSSAGSNGAMLARIDSGRRQRSAASRPISSKPTPSTSTQAAASLPPSSAARRRIASHSLSR